MKVTKTDRGKQSAKLKDYRLIYRSASQVNLEREMHFLKGKGSKLR